ncbi:MAG TPA: CHAT domain-containing protein [Pyrinomonadaceae bacterium]|jgi:hypothetical protein
MSKSWEQVNPLKYSNYRDDPVDLTLRFFTVGQRFDLDMEGEGTDYDRERLDISIPALADISRDLREQALFFIRNSVNRKKYSAEDWRNLLISLAKAGHKTFTLAFENKVVRERLRHLLSVSKQTRIKITAEDFTLPWELLYSDDVDEERLKSLDEDELMGNFWGMKHDISRMINQRYRPASGVSNTIHVSSRPSLGLITDNQLLHVTKKEIPFFENLKKAGKIDLFPMPELDPAYINKDAEMEKFWNFWDDMFNITHFACHASYKKNPQTDSSFRVTKGFCVDLFELKNSKITLKDYPLVILNACEMGKIDPLDSWFFAKEFISKGARGVIAAESPVPDVLAAQFTQELYKHLLAGKFVGESMLLTRRNLLKKNNPVGLLYSLYAPRNIRLSYQSNSVAGKRMPSSKWRSLS